MRTLSLLFLLGCTTTSESSPDGLQERLAALETDFEILQESHQNLLAQHEALTERLSEVEQTMEDLDAEDRLAQLETQASVVDVLQAENVSQADALTQVDSRLQIIEDNYLSAASLSGYATEIWVTSQGLATEAWTQSQGYALASDVTTNTTSITQNYGLISGNSSSINTLNTRVLAIENTYIQSTDLSGYATQLWVNGQGYAQESDLVTTATNLTLLDQDVSQHNTDILNLDVRLGVIEADYVTSNAVSDHATETWVLAQQYVSQSDNASTTSQLQQNTADILTLQSTVNTIDLDYVTTSDLSGFATEDWVLDSAALGSVVTDLNQYVSVDTATNRITFSGANLLIQSGSGFTDDDLSQGASLLGLGNLIIGYNDTDGSLLRSGSHNLIVGDLHSYSSYGGIVGGINNTISNKGSSVLGGRLNESSGEYSSICGGHSGLASGNHSSILGGFQNTSSNSFTTIAGGSGNEASGAKSTVSGGSDNIASGSVTSISGGDENEAVGLNTSILGGVFNQTAEANSSIVGGYNNTTNGYYSVILGGADNQTNGTSSSISGGYLNQTSGQRATIAGGYNNTTSNDYASICGGYLNLASGSVATISGGSENEASGDYSSISGGNDNAALGSYSSILGGNNVSISGLYGTSP